MFKMLHHIPPPPANHGSSTDYRWEVFYKLRPNEEKLNIRKIKISYLEKQHFKFWLLLNLNIGTSGKYASISATGIVFSLT